MTENMLPGVYCLRCRLQSVVHVVDEEGDEYLRCLACGRSSFAPREAAPLPARVPHRLHFRRSLYASPDAPSYGLPDSGCALATLRAGRQSRCLSCLEGTCFQDLVGREPDKGGIEVTLW